MLKRVATVGGFTLLSRVFGFVRDVLMAASLGAGLAADAFVIAFKLPNFFRRLFAEGAFSAGFVPFYAGTLEKNGTEKAKAFGEQVLAWFLPVLLVFLVIMEVGMAEVIDGLTGGFDSLPEKRDMTVRLARITFPYLVFISLVAFLASVLNAHGRFSAAAFAPLLLNAGMIAAMLIAPKTQETVALYLAYGVAIAGAAQFLWLGIAMHRAGLMLMPRLPKPSAELIDMLKVMAPAALGAAILQINLLIDIILAARFLEEGSVSWLFYADRLNQLTVGVVGVALGTVLLPTLSARFAAKDNEGALQTLKGALRFGLLIALPAAAALVILADPIIATLFQRGAFTRDYSTATSAALQAYALGLPAYVLIKCLTPAFYARKDTRTPVAIGVLAMLVNVAANLVLIGPYGHTGLALGTAIAALFQTVLLILFLRRDGIRPFDRDLWRFLLGSAGAAALMTGVLFFHPIWLPFSGGADIPGALGAEMAKILNLVILIIAGLVTYGAAILVMRVTQINDIKAMLKQPNP